MPVNCSNVVITGQDGDLYSFVLLVLSIVFLTILIFLLAIASQFRPPMISALVIR